MVSNDDLIAVKVKSYRVGSSGNRGFAISLPVSWIRDKNLKHGDLVDLYRTTDGRLILDKADCPQGGNNV